MELYIEAFKTLHEGGKPYTERYIEAFKTLHETERCLSYTDIGRHF